MAAVLLRVRVLEAQNRTAELVTLLDSVVSGATTIEQAAEIENLAQQKSLEAVRQHALEKQAALASDPVTRLQLRYTLAHLYESRKDFRRRAEKCGILVPRKSEDTRRGAFHGGFLLAHKALSSSHCRAPAGREGRLSRAWQAIRF